jgi:hypothetical protein
MAKAGDKPTPVTQYLRPRRHNDKDETADDPGGYQTQRVEKRLDQLEAEGTVLKNHTRLELRRKLEKMFKDDEKLLELPIPSRQCLDAVIKRRLS